MEWKQCSGVGQPAMRSQSWGGNAMCPVCTKYVYVNIGQPVPRHVAVVINSQSVQQDQRRPST